MNNDDILDSFTHAFAAMKGDPTPVWYMMLNGDLKGVVQHHEADTWQYRRMAEAKYPGCMAWTHNHLGWCSMPVDNMRYSIWLPGTPPEVLLMAKLLEF